ncbi:MAG: hypothetical protein ACKOTF_15680, partial [Opitutaceae bacterium]
LLDPAAPREPAVTTVFVNTHAVRSRDFRNIRHADGSEELYDHRRDPNEWRNLSGRAEMSKVIEAHSRFLPTVNAAPLPGSTGRGVDPAHLDWFGGVP